QQALLMEPDAPPLYNDNGTLNWAQNANGNSTWVNPLANYAIGGEYNNTTKNLVSNINISYRILPGLDIRSSFGYTNLVTSIYNTRGVEAYAPEQRVNRQGIASVGNRNMSTWIVEPQLQYNTTWG